MSMGYDHYEDATDLGKAYINRLKDERAKESARLDTLIEMLTPCFVRFTDEHGKITWALIDDSQFDEMKPPGWDSPKSFPTAREAIDAHIAAKKSGGNPYV